MSFLSDRTENALGDLAALDESADPLHRISAVRSLLLSLETEPALLTGVREALTSGAGWDDIAEATFLSPAAAKWRWQGTDDEITARAEAGRKRSARPSSVPQNLPGMSVSDAARSLGVSAQAVYLRIARGTLKAETVVLADGRSYKRVMPAIDGA